MASTPSTCLWVDVDDQLFKEVVCGMSGREGGRGGAWGDYFSLAGLGGVASRPLLERDLLLCLVCIFKLALGPLGSSCFPFCFETPLYLEHLDGMHTRGSSPRERDAPLSL